MIAHGPPMISQSFLDKKVQLLTLRVYHGVACKEHWAACMGTQTRRPWQPHACRQAHVTLRQCWRCLNRRDCVALAGGPGGDGVPARGVCAPRAAAAAALAAGHGRGGALCVVPLHPAPAIGRRRGRAPAARAPPRVLHLPQGAHAAIHRRIAPLLLPVTALGTRRQVPVHDTLLGHPNTTHASWVFWCRSSGSAPSRGFNGESWWSMHAKDAKPIANTIHA
jgi:hypothetical protein